MVDRCWPSGGGNDGGFLIGLAGVGSRSRFCAQAIRGGVREQIVLSRLGAARGADLAAVFWGILGESPGRARGDVVGAAEAVRCTREATGLCIKY